jgi:thiamine pyrophosphate-dependent acetolactate synthase large subunit-like protein
MSSSTLTSPQTVLGAQAVVQSLLRSGIDTGFGIPSIHNIPLYEVLRQAKQFHHWVVRHEQAAGYAADGYYRQSGRVAVVFASTGPGNLFTLVPLLESFQTNTPVLVIGTNIAIALESGSGGALHETPQQIDIFRPLTRIARRINHVDQIPGAIAEITAMFRSAAPGPAFLEIPHDLLAAPLTIPPVTVAKSASSENKISAESQRDLSEAAAMIAESHRPVILLGSGVGRYSTQVIRLAELLQAPVVTTTTGKGIIAADHPLSFGCISRLGPVQELFQQSDLLISFGTRLTEFDTGRFGLLLPAKHLQIVDEASYAGTRIRPTKLVAGDIGAISGALAVPLGEKARVAWFDLSAARAKDSERLEGLKSEAYAALQLLRNHLDRQDVVVNDQSILNYWASAFFPVMQSRTFLYPSGSGTLGYGLPSAIGAACALRQSGGQAKIICVAGDGGFQYTAHELATLAQYNLPVKILLVNDQAYGVIGFLQRSLFGQTHEVALRNPDFCQLAGAHGIQAERASSFDELEQRLPSWLANPGPALLEWRTVLQAPWEVGAIPRPTGISLKKEN